ncbi:MAG: hypothetical protein GXO19_02500 [Epsilonproteobacteria bacterium]|nr:hypothetical protein [Campylobacterota bacterium]NPA56588.1 hypothetical protein [Campylobacterota bacterium]
MILYIHGFGSCGWGEKSRTLKEYFGDLEAPDLPPRPLEAVKFLERRIGEGDIDLLIGSSLGGYYATYLGHKYRIKGVLLNPSTRPYETLKDFIGEQRRFCDGTPFQWKREYIKELMEYDTHHIRRNLFLVLLQSGDEVLDYRLALDRYRNQRRVVEYGGNHRFENIGDYLSMIKNFREDNGGH